jgi:probable rRNA maturation factor
MSLTIDVASAGVRVPLGRSRVIAIVRVVLESERVDDALISVAFITNRAIAAINRRHLGHPGATDVIAFALSREGGLPVIGDIYIAPNVARIHARQLRVGVREEIARLAVHGTLHVLGYDHPDGAARSRSPMWRRQEELVRRSLGRELH